MFINLKCREKAISRYSRYTKKCRFWPFFGLKMLATSAKIYKTHYIRFVFDKTKLVLYFGQILGHLTLFRGGVQSCTPRATSKITFKRETRYTPNCMTFSFYILSMFLQSFKSIASIFFDLRIS